MANVTGGGRVSNEVKIIVRDGKGKRVSKVDVRGGHSHHIVGKGRKALQIAFDNTNEFSHIDCKACDDNPWWSRDGTPASDQYNIEAVGPNLWKISCKKCGYESLSG
jgi:predicted nucleic-acid-binding Zn-ribbon protein